MKTKILLICLLFCNFLLLSSSQFPQVQDSIVVELHNNCGKKIELSVELLNNELSTSMENGVKSRFRLKAVSEIRVNKMIVHKLRTEDNGKIIRLCK
jgi:hypothetical protein